MKNQTCTDENQQNENFNTILRMLDESPSAHSGSVRSRCGDSDACEFESHHSYDSDSERSQETRQMSNVMQIMQSNSYHDRENRKEIAKMNKNFRPQKTKLSERTNRHSESDKYGAPPCAEFDEQTNIYKDYVKRIKSQKMSAEEEVS